MNFSRFSAFFLLISGALFLILTSFAMDFYPGSTFYNTNTIGYEFFQNFFSDLGSTQTYSGIPNTTSQVLFSISMVIVGVALTLFGWTQSKIFSKKSSLFLRSLSGLTATLSGAGFIWIAATPWNLYFSQHIDAVNIAFSFLLAFILTMTLIQRKAKWPKRYLVANYAYIFLLLFYILSLVFIPVYRPQSYLTYHVVLQKIIVYGSIFILSFQAIGEIIETNKKKKKWWEKLFKRK